jgi:CHAT domain-containing protein
VETTSAQQLVSRTFEHAKKGATRAESLRQAQLDLIEGRAGQDYSHPFFWAPYGLYGDPRD